MNDRIKEHLIKHCKANKWDPQEEGIFAEIIREGKEIWEGPRDDHRWYSMYDRVVEIDGMFIMYKECHESGDGESCPVFDLETVGEVRPEKVETIKYVPVK